MSSIGEGFEPIVFGKEPVPVAAFVVEGVVVDNVIETAGLLAVRCCICPMGRPDISSFAPNHADAPEAVRAISGHSQFVHDTDESEHALHAYLYGDRSPRRTRKPMSLSALEKMLAEEDADPRKSETAVAVSFEGVVYMQPDEHGERVSVDLDTECLLCGQDTTYERSAAFTNSGFMTLIVNFVEHSQLAHPGNIRIPAIDRSRPLTIE